MLASPQRVRPVRRSVMMPCQVVRERDFRLVARQMIDLSDEGLLVDSFERVLTGEPVIVSFRTPLASGWIDAEGVVARVVHGRRPRDRGHGLGVRFEAMAGEARDLLRRQLGWFGEARTRR